MAKEELFENALLGTLLAGVGAFPVRRGHPDRRALRRAIAIVNSGRVLGLFPEGTRSPTGELQEAKGGAAFIALKTGAPILPLAIRGPYRVFGEVEVLIGKPFNLDVQKSGPGRIEAAGEQIMAGIRRLLANR
jgi:1-acyl-sn-glycerol-3-phosphate acyltransferase